MAKKSTKKSKKKSSPTKKSTTKKTKKNSSKQKKNTVSIKKFFRLPKWSKGKRKKTKKKKLSKKALRIKRIKAFIFFSVLIGVGLWLFWGIPIPTKLTTNEFPVSTKLYDRNGKLLFEIYEDTRSTPIDLEHIPQDVKNATIAIEDKDFYKHYGFSITGIVRAAYKNIFKQKLEGGSTLTQQLVKNSLLTPERTIRRKIREFALTIIVETIYSKDQILEIYLNRIPYGSTAYGIGAASELYFNKSATDLTLAEASLLAGLPQRPTAYSPFGARPELAKGRQEAVLRRMVEDGYITQDQMDSALEEELQFAEPEVPSAPHFSLWVKEQLAEKYGDAVVERGGLRVTTTLDLELQEFAQESVATEVADLANYNVGNGAALVTKPNTGEILAMVGSKDFFAEDEDGKVNVLLRERQPGSSIKPLNYALAIADERLTASSPLADVPTCFSSFGQPAYCPKNYDGSVHGAVQLRYALANSYNIPAVRVLALNGIENFIDFARQMGITTFRDPSQYGLSLTLGGGEVRPYDMATAFGVFANQGTKVPLISILKVEDYKGNVLEEVDRDAIEGERVLNPDVPFIIADILSDNGARSAAFGSSSQLVVSGHPEVAVKTGTTNDLRDNWTVGFTPDAVVVVWVGNNDNEPMSGAVSGVSGASPIWNNIMQEVLTKAESGVYGNETDGHRELYQPDNVVGRTVCSDTGNAADSENPNCPTRFEYFIDTAIGARLESGIRDLQIERDKNALAQEELPPELKEVQQKLFVIDPLGTLICLDCAVHEWNVIIGYPVQRFEN